MIIKFIHMLLAGYIGWDLHKRYLRYLEQKEEEE